MSQWYLSTQYSSALPNTSLRIKTDSKGEKNEFQFYSQVIQMPFTDLDLWLFPCSYIFQGQLSCSIFNIPDRISRYAWHGIWEAMRKEFLQKKQAGNLPSSHCAVQRRAGGAFPRKERACSPALQTSWAATESHRTCTLAHGPVWT